MNLPFEVLLILGIVGFYVFDSARLLYFNELILAETYGHWSFACPRTRWALKGKLPFIPNPVTPDTVLLRVVWSVGEKELDLDALEKTRRFIQETRILGYFILVLFTLMIIILPGVLYRFGTGTFLLITFTSIYLTILALLGVVYRKRDALGLSQKAMTSIVIDCLACPPFAINLVRKISLLHPVEIDPVAFALEHFEKPKFAQLANALKERLDEELDLEEEGSMRSIEIKTYRDALIAKSSI